MKIPTGKLQAGPSLRAERSNPVKCKKEWIATSDLKTFLAMTPIYKLLIITAMFLINNTVFAKPKIVASISPITSIIAMLVEDKAELTTIAITNSCPHHYHLKPSDLKKIKDASLVVYINDEFDGFAAKLMKSHNNNVMKISDIKSIKIIDNNWHFWLDLSNIKILLDELAIILARNFPEIRNDIYLNLDKAKKQIEELDKIKNQKLSDLPHVILLSDSLEYFFSFNKENNTRLYQSHNSPRYLSRLEKLLNKSEKNCLILSSDQPKEFYKRFNTKIIELESENWADSGKIEQLFYKKYIKMIDEVVKCNDE